MRGKPLTGGDTFTIPPQAGGIRVKFITGKEPGGSVLDIEVSCFPNQKSPGNVRPVSLLAFLTSPKHHARQLAEVIGQPDEKLRKAGKLALPACTPSGTFSYRRADALVSHSGFVVIDVDERDTARLPALSASFAANPHVAYCGRSASYAGLFVIFWCPRLVENPDRHKDVFGWLVGRFAKAGITAAVDSGCSDVSRLRGYSHDPLAYINHSPEPLPLPPAPQKPAEAPPRHARPFAGTAGPEAECFTWCVSVKGESGFVPGDRNGWLTRLVLMCNEFGVSRPLVESECTARYVQDGFTEAEVLAAIRSIYRNHKAKHGVKVYTAPAPAPMPPPLPPRPPIRPATRPQTALGSTHADTATVTAQQAREHGSEGEYVQAATALVQQAMRTVPLAELAARNPAVMELAGVLGLVDA